MLVTIGWSISQEASWATPKPVLRCLLSPCHLAHLWRTRLWDGMHDMSPPALVYVVSLQTQCWQERKLRHMPLAVFETSEAFRGLVQVNLKRIIRTNS